MNRPDSVEAEYARIVKTLPTQAPIFLPTDRISNEEKLAGIRKVKDIYEAKLDSLYAPQLKALREKYKGKERCFIIGNGPSLNKTDLSVLKDEVVFAVNGFFLKANELDWVPTFYVVEDHLVAEDRREWINKFQGPTKLFPAYLGYCLEENDDTIFFNHRPRKSYPRGFDFSTDASKVTYAGCTVTFTCLQLAHYLGFKEIYLIGVDADYNLPKDLNTSDSYSVGVLDMKSDDVNHFHPDYFGKGFRWHDPQVEKMIEAYGEARRVADESGRRIYNATVGGKLEVFERRSFKSLFPNARSEEVLLADTAAVKREQGDRVSPAPEMPRLLLIDHTEIGDGTATGELKSSLFADYPSDRLLCVSWKGGRLNVRRHGVSRPASNLSEVSEEVRAFAPDCMLYRPVPDVSEFHRAAMSLLRQTAVPLITWIMDDWPARLEQEDPQQFRRLSVDWGELLEASSSCFSIGKSMSRAFEERYGKHFIPFANGVDPSHWPTPSPGPDGKFVVRYAGSLAHNMTLESVARVGKAVDLLVERGYDAVFEIKTRPMWREVAAPAFENCKSVKFTIDDLSPEAYRRWLSGANVVAIAYNYDPASLRYVQYSVANKLPECMASGAALLAHGPRQAATIEYIEGLGCAATVTEKNVEKIADELELLLRSPDRRLELAEAAQAIAFRDHNVLNISRQFRQEIANAAVKPAMPIGYSRQVGAHLDETAIVADLLNKRRGAENVMLDVGAHQGGSAEYFQDLGWSIYCFEPDANNRQILESRFRRSKNVRIDPRAVGEHAQQNAPFFSSPESTGVSSLGAFLDSHGQTGTVDVTTVENVVKDQNLDNVTFLKIDVEGFDFDVLRGVPWEKIQPEVIECEFEDTKTLPRGIRYQDIADYLIERGYTVYVSEWHPIVRYGARHQWKRLLKYPVEALGDGAWGNFLAFRDDPGEVVLRGLFEKHAQRKRNSVKVGAFKVLRERGVMAMAYRLSVALARWAHAQGHGVHAAGRFYKWILKRLVFHWPLAMAVGIAGLVLLILAVAAIPGSIVGLMAWFLAFILLVFLSVSGVAVYVSGLVKELSDGRKPMLAQDNRLLEAELKKVRAQVQLLENQLQSTRFERWQAVTQRLRKRFAQSPASGNGDPSWRLLIASCRPGVAIDGQWIGNVESLIGAYARQVEGAAPVLLLHSEGSRTKTMHTAFGLDEYKVSDQWKNLQSRPDLKEWAREQVAKRDLREIDSLTYRGVPAGRLGLATARLMMKKSRPTSAGDWQLVERYVAEAAAETDFDAQFLDEQVPSVILTNHATYSDKGGPMLHLALQRDIPVFSWQSRGPKQLVLRQFDQDSAFAHVSDLTQKYWQDIENKVGEDRRIKEIQDWLSKRLAGDGQLVPGAPRIGVRNQPDNDLAGIIDPDRPNVAIFTHLPWDASGAFYRDAFPSLADWIEATIDVAKSESSINWIVRIHPAEAHRGSDEDTEKLIRNRLSGETNIKIIPSAKPLSSYALIPYLSAAVTVRGTMAAELPCFGIPVVCAGSGYACSLAGVQSATDPGEYIRNLRNVANLEPVKGKALIEAQLFSHAFFIRNVIELDCVEDMSVMSQFEELTTEKVYGDAGLKRIVGALKSAVELPS